MKLKNEVIILLFLLLISCAPLRPVRTFKEEPTVRILLLRDPDRMNVSSDFGLNLRTGKNQGKVKGNIRFRFGSLDIYTDNGRIKNPGYPVYLTPEKGTIYLNGRPYPGGIKILKTSCILVVNHVPVEDYLMGVLPYEMGNLPEEMLEALKAQAVAARSYVMSNRKPGEPYDILPSIWDQVYGGVERVDDITRRAVKETRGIVATYNGKIIDAKYSSTCGGFTEDNENVWTGENVPYLRSVKDSGWDGQPFCRFSPHYEWKRSYDKSKFFRVVIRQIEKLFGETPGDIRWIRIVKRTRSRRVRTIEINTDIGKFYIERDNIRRLFADFRGSIKSLLFWLKIKGGQVIIRGRGYGHGVGMCQYGAMEMAKENYDFRQILHHYYTGVRLRKVW